MGGRRLILLDTHVLIWLDQDNPDLGPTARERADRAHRAADLAVSAVSFWEIAMLAAKGRIVVGLPLPKWRLDLLRSGLVEIALDGRLGIAAAELGGIHSDPADRMIVASARANGATLLTADERIPDWPGKLDRLDARL